MHNLVLSPIDPETLISSISERVTANILKAVKPENPLTEHQLLTIQQAAEFLSLSVPTIYGLVSRSEIPVMKLKKRLYFSKQELIDWVKSGRKRTISEIQNEAGKCLIDKRKG